MVHGGHDVEFELSVRGRLEHSGIDFYFFHAGTVEFFEGCDDTGLFPCAGWPVD